MRTPCHCFVVGIGILLAACSPQPQPAQPVAQPKPAPARAEVPAIIEPASAAAETIETWELPGTLHPLTTVAELQARFGKDNLGEETFPGPEGIGTYPALVIHPDDPRKRLELVLDADNKDAPIQSLRVSAANTLWHAADGLRPGMSLAELVALNGAPVSFYGLDWDYGGSVQDWHGGKLANTVGARLFHAVTLAPRDATGDAKLPSGDAVFRSDDPKWPGIGKQLVIGELSISWPHDDE
ncbi:MAG: hypothetical protein QM612_12460 [Thermomonas sp.]|uniref:hypothetical protein n=1 Tax=Thermomonas sp. TaxID=1971895 RepID=UPI0039E38BAB